MVSIAPSRPGAAPSRAHSTNCGMSEGARDGEHARELEVD
jgi:hypothetical protein